MWTGVITLLTSAVPFIGKWIDKKAGDDTTEKEIKLKELDVDVELAKNPSFGAYGAVAIKRWIKSLIILIIVCGFMYGLLFGGLTPDILLSFSTNIIDLLSSL